MGGNGGNVGRLITTGDLANTLHVANMKTITAIYLNCKPELRDEWLAAIDIDSEVEESNVGRVLVRSSHWKLTPFPIGSRKRTSHTHQILP